MIFSEPPSIIGYRSAERMSTDLRAFRWYFSYGLRPVWAFDRDIPFVMTSNESEKTIEITVPVERRAARRAKVSLPEGDLPRPSGLEHGGRHNVVIIGLNRRSRCYLDGAEAYQSKGVRVVGVLDTSHANADGSMENQLACEDSLKRMKIPHLGTLDWLPRVLIELPIDEVHITLPIKSCYDEIANVLAICEGAGVPVSLSTDLFDSASARMCFLGDSLGGSRLHYSCAQRTSWDRFTKRAMDAVGSLFALTVFAIPMLLIALAVKLTSRGSVFFAQDRLGMNHRPFKMLKFRTMVANAEDLREELSNANEMDGPVFKIKTDPRITRVGRFLRKFSLDELPQFINVLRGDMSLVGPRPPIAKEVVKYEWWQRRRLSTRPGLTCFWQISGRNEIDFVEWMRLDLRYIDNWSLWLDVKLLFKTIPAVIHGSGAS